jgi:hypothetical protein
VRALLTAFLLACAWPWPAAGQGATLRIRVVNDSTGAPIHRAEVVLDDGSPLITDSVGRVQLTGVDPGERSLKASRLGYRPQRIAVRLAPGAELEVEVALREEWLALPDLVVTVKELDARLRDVHFYERRRSGSGIAWSWRDLRDLPSDPQGFLTHIPGFTLRPAGGDTLWVLESRRGPGIAPCPVSVLVDGRAADARQLNSLRLEHIAGIEAYLGPASTPADVAVLTGGSRCGVVVIWLRSG